MCTSTRAFRKGSRAQGRDREWAPCTCIYSCINILGRRIRFDRWDPRETETETEMDRLPRRSGEIAAYESIYEGTLNFISCRGGQHLNEPIDRHYLGIWRENAGKARGGRRRTAVLEGSRETRPSLKFARILPEKETPSFSRGNDSLSC